MKMLKKKKFLKLISNMWRKDRKNNLWMERNLRTPNMCKSFQFFTNSLSFMKKILPKYFDSEWSFA